MVIERNYGFPDNLDPQGLTRQRQEGLAFTIDLDEREYPEFPPSISAVVIFASSDKDYLRGMDAIRIKRGIEIATVITSNRKTEKTGKCTPVTSVNKDDFADFGPYLFYNGTRDENKNFLVQLQSAARLIPEDKVLVVDEFKPKKGSNFSRYESQDFISSESGAKFQEQKNTRDQVESLFTQIANPRHPISKCTDIALVSHIPHFIRIPYYIGKNEEVYKAEIIHTPTFWTYGIRPKNGAYGEFIKDELEKLGRYKMVNDLGTKRPDSVKIA